MRAILFALVATLVVVPEWALGQHQFRVDEGWIKSAPTVDQVFKDIVGSDQIDTRARQAAAFDVLADAVRVWTGLVDKKEMTFRALEKLEAYTAAYSQSPYDLTFDDKCRGLSCPAVKFGDKRLEYMVSSKFAREVLTRYFAPQYVDVFMKFKNQAADKADAEFKETVVRLLFRLLAVAALALLGYGLYRLFTWKSRLEKRRVVEWADYNRRTLDQFGSGPEERAAKIDEVFDRRTEGIGFTVNERELKCSLSRQLSTMSPREREALRCAYHLHNLGLMPENNFYIVRLSLVFAQGKGVIFEGGWFMKTVNPANSMEDAIRRFSAAIDVESAVNVAFHDLLVAQSDHPDHPILKRVVSRLFGDGNDLIPTAPLKSGQRGEPPQAGLILGLDSNDPDTWWYFDGEGSLITIAPPGSGKTQSQVFPNLLTWKGSAVVLDVKGEIYDQTSKWRRENVGPVYKFSPLDPATSHCFNPLTQVRSDPEFLWEDARFLADMMVVPSGTKETFWEDRSRDLLTAAIARVCIEPDPGKRRMEDVLDILHGIGWAKFVSYLQARVDIRSMVRAGHSLAGMEDKMKDSVLQSVQTNVSAWAGERIARATKRSDWNPIDLRSAQHPTVYICLKPNEIGSYTSLLRVFIAQHIRGLTGGAIPSRDEHPILFLLDELPRLEYMPPIEEALEIGRQYGLKLWMFAQDLGQLKKAYENANGMIGGCAVRMFMNPSSHDGTAQKISDDIGFRESVLDGSRVKIVEPNILSGPDFKDFVIVMAASAKAARLRKYFAYADPALTSKMATPVIK